MHIKRFINRHHFYILMRRTSSNGWSAALKDSNGEYIDSLHSNSNMLWQCVGFGRTRKVALEELCQEVAGRILVLDAMSDEHRRELRAPSELFYDPVI